MTAGAYLAGTLTAGVVQAIRANITSRTRALFAEHEAELVPLLSELTVDEAVVAMQQWARRAEAIVQGDAPTDEHDLAHLSRLSDGSWKLDATLSPEAGEDVATALRLATPENPPGEPVRTAAQRRADALATIVRFYLDHHDAPPSRRHRPHVNLMVDLFDLQARHPGTFDDGTPIDPNRLRRICCDAGIHRVVTAGRSHILDYGTTVRSVPIALWQALIIRDGHCRFPGSDRPPQFCDAHHFHHWVDGGLTSLDNTGLMCGRHHDQVHQPGWQAKLLPDGTIHITTPTGRMLTGRPRSQLPFPSYN